PFARRRPVGDLGRVTDAWASSAAVKAIALAPGVLGMLDAVYGRHPLPFQTLNFKYGTEQRPHADAVHFNTEPSGLMCGVGRDGGHRFGLRPARPLPRVTP